ncbi:GIY-YIG nuclease family protein [Vibrio sp. WXL103]|uniref:GIY-YIG nuclease family protein n=1 Tax=Vibrio sp. WXL103 TaxID=3450710 RepID=UPI003EC836F1
MFLTFGVAPTGEWISIGETKAGKTELVCPFCKQQLIARKGKIKSHHFAHHGNTCQLSEKASQNTQLPTIDHFELLDTNELKYLERRQQYQHKDIYSWGGERRAIERLEAMQILSVEYEDTKNQNVVAVTDNLRALRKGYINEAGKPSQAFMDILEALEPITGKGLAECWQDSRKVIKTSINRSYHTNKLSKLSKFGHFEAAQRYWLDAYYRKIALLEPDFIPLLDAKLRSLNEQSLYVFLFEIDIANCPKRIVKIGMTTRPVEQRYKEVKAMLRSYGKVTSSSILATKPLCGRLERLLHHHFADQFIPLKQHREFFALSDEQIQQLINDLNQAGDIKRYNPPVIALAKEIKAAGRKKKTANQLLAEYPQIVDCLARDLGIRPTARETGTSVNTVQKVKAALNQKDC